MIKVIEKVNQNLKIENLDVVKKPDPNMGEFYDGDQIKKFVLSSKPLKLPCKNPMYMACYDNTIICCANNGYTYLKIGENFQMIGVISVLGKVVLSEIILEGIRYPLIIGGDNKAYKLENNDLVKIADIDADFVCNNGDRLFYSKGRNITFSAPNDMLDFNFGLNKAGQITIEDGVGDIVALATENKKVIIFTKKAVFEFCPIGSYADFTLRKIETDPLDVCYESVKDVGDRIAFVSNGCLYCYKDGKVYMEQSYLRDNECSIRNYPVLDGKIYYVPIRKDGKEYIYRYDFDKKKNYLINIFSTDLYDGNYPVCIEDNLYQIVLETVDKYDSFIIGKNTSQLIKKTIVKVSVYVVGSATITITGDDGRRRFNLKSGLNEKRLNYRSVNFSVDITDKSSDFELREMQIKYKLKGE